VVGEAEHGYHISVTLLLTCRLCFLYCDRGAADLGLGEVDGTPTVINLTAGLFEGLYSGDVNCSIVLVLVAQN
jgi:hypothetical protein